MMAGDQVYSALAHATRRLILTQLRAGEQPATKLAEPYDMSLAAISQHLKILRESGLVVERREGRQRIYRLNAKPLREVHRWLNHFEGFWLTRLDALDTHLRRNPK